MASRGGHQVSKSLSRATHAVRPRKATSLPSDLQMRLQRQESAIAAFSQGHQQLRDLAITIPRNGNRLVRDERVLHLDAGNPTPQERPPSVEGVRDPGMREVARVPDETEAGTVDSLQ